MSTFPALGAGAPVADALARRDIRTPFPIQEMVIPDALAGRDVLARSRTGSGKTLAFAVPIAERLRPKPAAPAALVLVPTRELATQVVEEMADSLGGLIPVDDLAIHVHEPRLGRLRPLLARGAAADSWMKRPLSDASGVAAEALASGEARHVRRLGRRPAALIVAPLRGRERVLGVLSLRRNGREARFEAKEFDLVRLFGAHVSIALQNAFAHRAVELRAQTDALTGLKNHGTFQDSLAAAVERGAPFALLMVDLDDFKAYNDRHGHEAGNEMLRSIAVALQAACRESDEVYRYGGDEFTLILMQSGCGGALEVAERVRRAVRDARGVVGDMRSAVRDAGSPEPDAPSRGRDHAARMRCSVGVACFPDDAATRAELLVAADRALYAAKRAGRDRTASAASLR